MTHSYSRSSQFTMARNDKDQAFSDVVAAISEGKYSWACVLMLRSAGYNPLHYMPYRTYNRIIKANLKLGGNRAAKQAAKQTARQTAQSSSGCSTTGPQSIAPSPQMSQANPVTQSNPVTPINQRAQSTQVASSLYPNIPSGSSRISDLSHLDSAAPEENEAILGGSGSAPSAQTPSSWWSTLISKSWH